MAFKVKIRQKNIPNGVWYNSELQSYLKNQGTAGYIGADERTYETDKLVVSELKKKGLTDEEIAVWLTSGDGRHLMDNFSKKNLREYSKFAKAQVTKWHSEGQY